MDFPRVFRNHANDYIVLLGPAQSDPKKPKWFTSPGIRIYADGSIDTHSEYFVDLETRGWERIL